jgi:hypothetical protein
MQTAANVLTALSISSTPVQSSALPRARSRPGFVPTFIRTYAAALCVASRLENAPPGQQREISAAWFQNTGQ